MCSLFLEADCLGVSFYIFFQHEYAVLCRSAEKYHLKLAQSRQTIPSLLLLLFSLLPCSVCFAHSFFFLFVLSQKNDLAVVPFFPFSSFFMLVALQKRYHVAFPLDRAHISGKGAGKSEWALTSGSEVACRTSHSLLLFLGISKTVSGSCLPACVVLGSCLTRRKDQLRLYKSRQQVVMPFHRELLRIPQRSSYRSSRTLPWETLIYL